MFAIARHKYATHWLTGSLGNELDVSIFYTASPISPDSFICSPCIRIDVPVGSLGAELDENGSAVTKHSLLCVETAPDVEFAAGAKCRVPNSERRFHLKRTVVTIVKHRVSSLLQTSWYNRGTPARARHSALCIRSTEVHRPILLQCAGPCECISRAYGLHADAIRCQGPPVTCE